MDTGRLSLADDHLVVDFTYDPALVAEIKKIDGAKWDKVGRVWRVPMVSIDDARSFAIRYGMHVETDVMLFDVPDSDNVITGVTWESPWIFLSFRWDPVKVRSVKQLPGVTWHAPTKAWRVPETAMTAAIDWADRFGEEVSERMRSQAKRVAEQQEELIAASRATDADLDIPNLIGSLLPYQRAGVRYAVNARRTFIADDMGLGKSLQSIATLELADSSRPSYPAVIVCPPSLVLNWRNEFNKWMPHRTVAVVTNRKDFPPKGYDVVVVGWSNIHAWGRELSKHNSYVFDESHYAKTPTSQRTKAAKKIARTAPDDGIVLCLTGTPITNRPAEYASQLDILGKLDKFGGLWGFYRRYCAAFRDKWGQWHLEGSSNLDELNDRLRGECYIRRTKEQVLKELPPVRHSRLVVAGSATGMKEYRKAEADIVEYVTQRAREIAEELGVSPGAAAVRAKMAAEANQHLVRIGVLRKLAAQAKMAAVTEFVDSHISEGKKVVVAAHHREIVDELANRYGNLKIQGGMDVELVEQHKKLFQEGSVDEAPVIVLSIQAAKTGHTLTAAQDVLFVELPWTPADVDQTYSRCHRLGQMGSVSVTYMLCEGTIDEEIFAVIEDKRDVVNAAVEGGTTIGKDGVERLLSLFMAV